MVVGSVVRPRIVDAAIELFGVYGYEGVNMRQLAHAAKTTTGTLYRLFSSKKEKVYGVAVNEAVNRALKAVAESVFVLLDNPEAEDFLSMIGQALKLWYSALGQAEARLLMQVEIADPKFRQSARMPLEKITNHIAKALRKAVPHKKLDMHVIAQGVIAALFQVKISEHSDSGKRQMESLVNQFVLSMASAE